MSRTKKTFKEHNRKKSNYLGICNCVNCRIGRAGKKNSKIEKLKNKIRKWNGSREFVKGAYTD